MSEPSAVPRHRLLAAGLVLLRPGLGPLYLGAPRLAVVVEVWRGVLYVFAALAAVFGAYALAVPLGAAALAAPVIAWVAVFSVDADEFVPSWYHRWWGYLAFAVVGLLANIVLVATTRTWIAEPYRIPAGSMMPTLEVGDHVLVARGPFMDPIERGTIIVFRYPLNRDQNYIKRVLAVAGDRVRMNNGVPIVNGAALSRSPLGTRGAADKDCSVSTLDAAVEEQEGRSYTVLHDLQAGILRNKPAEEITVPPGHVFVLGDNRDASLDSRVWGFVPMEDIKGTARIVWMSWDACGAKFRGERLGMRL